MSNVVEILVKAKDQTKGGFDSADKSASGFGNKVAKGAKVAGAALVMMGGGAMFVAGKAEEARVAQDRLANALDNQGVGAATDRVAAYADELEALVAVDGEVIKAGQAKLATFKNVAASADEAGGAFDRATIAALDMAATGFGTAESNAASLGKILDNPAKGLSKLKKAGVEFTDAEAARIKTLVASNKLGEAQALILDKVEGKFAGSAESTKTNGAAMGIAFENLTESLGAGLLPHMDKLTGIVQAATGFMSEHSNVVMGVVGVLAGLAVTVVAVNAAVKVYSATTAIISGVTKAAAAAQWLLNAAMTANPIGLVVAAVVALVGALVLAYKNSETFREIVNGAFRAVQKGASFAFNWVKDHWPLLLAILTGPFGIAVLVILKNRDRIVGFFRSVPGAIGKVFAGLGAVITAPFTLAFNAIKSLWNSTVGGFGFSIPDWVPKVGGKSFNIPNMQHGGVGGGLTMVGEAGRELVRLPYGSTVIPNGQTERMMAGGGGGGSSQPLIVQMVVEGKVLQQVLLTLKRNNGNVELGIG